MPDGSGPGRRETHQVQLISRLKAELASRGLPIPAAAREIGVGAATLRKHLDGEHVRSDSALKYQDWLDGRVRSGRSVFLDARDHVNVERSGGGVSLALPAPPPTPRIVVDIFSGCGGLSLGFEILPGEHFRTGLAIDVEQAPISVLNANQRHARPVGRRADLTDRKSTRLNSSHTDISRMPSSA